MSVRNAPAAARVSPVAPWVPALRCATAGMTDFKMIANTAVRSAPTTVIPEWRRSRHIRDPGRPPPVSVRRAPAAARVSPVAPWVPALRYAAAGMTDFEMIASTAVRSAPTPVIRMAAHPGMAAQPTYPGPRRPPPVSVRNAPAAARASPVAPWVPALRYAAAGMTTKMGDHNAAVQRAPLPPPTLPEPRRLFRPHLGLDPRHRALVDRLPRRGQGLVGELQVEQFQALDLVAQAGRFLELQVAGRLAHAVFQVAQGGLEVGAQERPGVLGHARHRR